MLYASGNGIKQDALKASELFDKSCDLGTDMACFYIANFYYEGEKVKQDKSRAVEFYQRACSKGNSSACIKAGYILVKVRESNKMILRLLNFIA